MSSAYACDCKKVVEDKRSFINIEKSVGSRMDPWGTPKLTVHRGEVELPTFTCRPVRKDFSNVRNQPVIPIRQDLFS